MKCNSENCTPPKDDEETEEKRQRDLEEIRRIFAKHLSSRDRLEPIKRANKYLATEKDYRRAIRSIEGLKFAPGVNYFLADSFQYVKFTEMLIGGALGTMEMTNEITDMVAYPHSLVHRLGEISKASFLLANIHEYRGRGYSTPTNFTCPAPIPHLFRDIQTNINQYAEFQRERCFGDSHFYCDIWFERFRRFICGSFERCMDSRQTDFEEKNPAPSFKLLYQKTSPCWIETRYIPDKIPGRRAFSYLSTTTSVPQCARIGLDFDAMPDITCFGKLKE